MLKLEHINKVFNQGTIDEKTLFSDFNISIEKGEFVAVVGSNGSGKTTMLNIASGDVIPDFGTSNFGRRRYNQTKKLQAGKENCACVSKSFGGNLSVNDDIREYVGGG